MIGAIDIKKQLLTLLRADLDGRHFRQFGLPWIIGAAIGAQIITIVMEVPFAERRSLLVHTDQPRILVGTEFIESDQQKDDQQTAPQPGFTDGSHRNAGLGWLDEENLASTWRA